MYTINCYSDILYSYLCLTISDILNFVIKIVDLSVCPYIYHFCFTDFKVLMPVSYTHLTLPTTGS